MIKAPKKTGKKSRLELNAVKEPMVTFFERGLRVKTSIKAGLKR
jgi:hypothetical protein